MGIFTNKSPTPHNNTPFKPKTNLGGIPVFGQTTGTLPGSAPDVNIPSTQGFFGNPKAALNALPTIFKLSV